MNKHIFLCTDDPGVGGAAQYNHSILCGLAELGYRITCVQPEAYNDNLITYQKKLGIQHTWLNSSQIEQWQQSLLKSSEKPDIFICSNSNPFSNFYVKQIANQLEIPYIIIEHLVEPHLAENFAVHLDELAYYYRQARSVIAVSHNNLSLLHKLFKLPNRKGQVIYNGRPSHYFTPIDLSIRDRLRNELNIPTDAVICFTAARIETRKGYQYQLEAIKQLMYSFVWEKLYFVWAGAGIFEPQLEMKLKASVKQLRVADKVKFLGQLSNVFDWLCAADIFVFPSQLEGMPLCVMEAMAKGLPGIATAVSGIPEELGDTGKLLPDPKFFLQATIRELVTTIQNWAVNSSLRYSVGQACKQRAEKMFREERMIEKTAKVIEEALNKLENNTRNTPLVSVIIPCYKQAYFLPEAVASVVAQTYSNWEIIIVNDGSPDNTTEVATQLISLYPQKIRLIEKENGGLSSARNAGISVASGDYILPLDADDKLSTNAIACLFEIALEREMPCITFGSYKMFGIDQRTCVSIDFYSTENIKRFNMLVATSLYHKKVWVLTNGYKTSMKEGYEDWDFWLNCHQHNIPFYGTSEVVLYYRKQSGTMLANAREHHEKLYSQLVYNYPNLFKSYLAEESKTDFKVTIDGVFFQLYQTGIARVWRSLLQEWLNTGFAKHIIVLDRAGTAPKISGIKYRSIPPYKYDSTDEDRAMLQQVCDEEEASLFISTYYTTPLSTPSVFLAHDMIPELMGADFNHPMWREKHYGIQHAAAYIAVSESTARDLVSFFPDISLESVTVAYNGIEHGVFSPASKDDINLFKAKYGISKPYFLLVGAGDGYKNSILFFKAFAQISSKQGFDIVCTGSGWLAEFNYRDYTSGNTVHMLQLSDEELSIAYSGAVALVYPSKYEGFGLPVLEALACGCPVITCPNGAIPEVAGEAAIYVNDWATNELVNALCDVQKPDIRNSVIIAGLQQAKKFSWSKMADVVSSALIDATLLPLNLRETNFIIFPDWSQPEELLSYELEQVIREIATRPDSDRITLLVDNGHLPVEEANLVLSGVAMNLLMQEDLDISDGLEISLVGHLSEIQWSALLPRIQARIVLEKEDKKAIALAKAATIPYYELNSFINSPISE